MRRSHWGLVLLLLLVLGSRVSAEDLRQRLEAGARSIAPSDRPLTLQDREVWELFLVSEVLSRGPEPAQAEACRNYLRAYFPNPPLLVLLPPRHTTRARLETYVPDPDLERVAQQLWALTRSAPSETKTWEDTTELLRSWVPRLNDPDGPAALNDFVRAHPASPWAGWIAYRRAWDPWLAHGDRSRLQHFALAHPDHPLAREAGEAMSLAYADPNDAARWSALFPGLGQERLEPGNQEAAQQGYTEVLYLLGLGYFAFAAQTGHRQSYSLTALIFANLLIFNHQSSADNAWRLAGSRNLGTYRAFQRQHLDQTVLGSGTFTPASATPTPRVRPDPGWTLAVEYPLFTVAEGYRGQGLVEDEELSNLGVRLERFQPLSGEIEPEGYSQTWAVIPWTRGFWNRASGAPDLFVRELSLGSELACLNHWRWDDGQIMLRISLGPELRDRSMQQGEASYADQGLAASATLAVNYSGVSPVFWQAALTHENDWTSHAFQVDGRTLAVPSGGTQVHFGLGVTW